MSPTAPFFLYQLKLCVPEPAYVLRCRNIFLAGLRYYIPPTFLGRKGGPEGIRTLGHLVKSQMLYLAELQAQRWATVSLFLYIILYIK